MRGKRLFEILTSITYFEVYPIVFRHLPRSNEQIESNLASIRVRANSKSRVTLENVDIFLKNIDTIPR